MKNTRFIFAALLLFVSFQSIAQVGIGTASPNVNAKLELSATDKGFLPPRVALSTTTSFSPLAAHVEGMMVYNTATAGSGNSAVTPGYYLNNGTKWVKVLSEAD